MIYAVIGATGQTGGIVAKTLTEAGHRVRAVVRHSSQTDAMRGLGYEPCVAEVDDIDALATAFSEVDGAYLLNPPAHHHANLFARAHTVHAALLAAVQRARLENVVALSSVGGQVASGTGNILTTHDFETRIRNSGQPIKVLRAANFMDNYAWSLHPVMDQGILPSMFLPVDRALPMVSSIDIGQTAAAMLMSGAVSPRLVELHGPRDYSPIDAANAFSAALGKVITAVEAPRQSWTGVFEKSGFSSVTVEAFCEMFDGFNNDVIRFDGSGTMQRGIVTLEQVVADLVKRTPTHQAAPETANRQHDESSR